MTTMSIYLFCRMKPAHSANPSRSEILTWINSYIEQAIGPVKKIEELGNGAAYLLLLSILRPASFRSDKIIRHPCNHHEAMHNLKLLANAIQKLQLNFKFEIEKIAQMKYQENYYLACRFYKAFANSPEEIASRPSFPETKENSSHSNNRSRIRILPPEKKIEPILVKQSRERVTNEDLLEQTSNSTQKLKEIEMTIRDSTTNQHKLEKIAAILNIRHSKHAQQSTATMTQDNNINPLSIEASYKRFLRPSLCQKSSFLNKSHPLSFQKSHGSKIEVSVTGKHLGVAQEAIPPSSEFQGEMLLSQKKQPESQKQQECEVIVDPFVGEAREAEKGEETAQEQLYPSI